MLNKNLNSSSFYPASVAILILTLILTSTSVHTQETAPPQRSLARIGIWGHAAWQQQNAQFIGLANATSLQEPYRAELASMRLSANPFQWSAGLLGEIPVWESEGTSLGVAARLGAQAFGATFTSSLANLPIAGLSVPGTLDFTLQTNALFLNAAPMVQWRFGQNRFALMAGMSFATVLRETTSQSRILTAAVPIAQEIRQQHDGNEPSFLEPKPFVLSKPFEQRITSSVLVGASWEVPIGANGAFLLVPEVFYALGLNTITTNLLAPENLPTFWRVSTVRAGFALKFAPEKPVIPPPPPPPTPEVPLPSKPVATPAPAPVTSAKPLVEPLTVRIASLAGVEADGRRVENPTLKLEEFLASSSRYLLPSVFFSENSALLPERYVRFRTGDLAAFAPDSVLRGTFAQGRELDVYYNLLNIIGLRMRKYAAARLTLTGYNDAANETPDKTADKTLALRRAEAVKVYLCVVWGIAQNRIATKSGGTRGISEIIDAEENRVVEVQTTQAEILEELRYDYILRTTQPAKLEIEPDITAPEGLASWSMAVSGQAANGQASDRPASVRLADFSGAIAPKLITWGVERVFAASPLASEPIVAPEPLRLTLRGTDKLRTSSEASVRIPLEILTIAEKQRRNSPDVRVGTYWVFCFNLNSRQILVDERIRRAVQGIKSSATPDASIEITGYADTRGNVEKNRKLSDDRAEAVLQLIGMPSSKVASVEGKGESTLYDNDLPEGRLYNRFVRVDVRTPMERKR